MDIFYINCFSHSLYVSCARNISCFSCFLTIDVYDIYSQNCIHLETSSNKTGNRPLPSWRYISVRATVLLCVTRECFSFIRESKYIVISRRFLVYSRKYFVITRRFLVYSTKYLVITGGIPRHYEKVSRLFENELRYYKKVSRLFEKVPRYFEKKGFSLLRDGLFFIREST